VFSVGRAVVHYRLTPKKSFPAEFGQARLYVSRLPPMGADTAPPAGLGRTGTRIFPYTSPQCDSTWALTSGRNKADGTKKVGAEKK